MMLFEQYQVNVLQPVTVLLDLDDGTFDAVHQAVDDDELMAVLELVTQLFLERNPATRRLVAGVVIRAWGDMKTPIAPFCGGKVDSRTARRLLLELAGMVEGREKEAAR